MIKIYVEDNSEFRQYEANMKEFRYDVYAKIDGNYYNLSFITFNRLKQEVESCFEENEIYDIDNNIVIVKEITNEEIINNILYLKDHQNYFAKTKPCTINNSHIIYELTEVEKKEKEKMGWRTSFLIDKLERIY